jgi:hypothetical protein
MALVAPLSKVTRSVAAKHDGDMVGMGTGDGGPMVTVYATLTPASRRRPGVTVTALTVVPGWLLTGKARGENNQSNGVGESNEGIMEWHVPS